MFERRHGERARHDGAPDGREGSVGAKHVSELRNSLSGVGAKATLIDATESVAIQTAHSTRAQALDVRG